MYWGVAIAVPLGIWFLGHGLGFFELSILGLLFIRNKLQEKEKHYKLIKIAYKFMVLSYNPHPTTKKIQDHYDD